MTEDEIFLNLKNRMVELFEVPPDRITLQAKLRDDLELDSIDAVDMAVELQKLTGRRVDFESLRSLETIADVVTLVDTYLREPKSGAS